MDKKTIAHQNPIAPSELIVTDEGRIYHLDLHPDDIADDIIVVGDQERVPLYPIILIKLILKELKENLLLIQAN